MLGDYGHPMSWRSSTKGSEGWTGCVAKWEDRWFYSSERFYRWILWYSDPSAWDIACQFWPPIFPTSEGSLHQVFWSITSIKVNSTPGLCRRASCHFDKSHIDTTPRWIPWPVLKCILAGLMDECCQLAMTWVLKYKIYIYILVLSLVASSLGAMCWQKSMQLASMFGVCYFAYMVSASDFGELGRHMWNISTISRLWEAKSFQALLSSFTNFVVILGTSTATCLLSLEVGHSTIWRCISSIFDHLRIRRC